LIFGFAHTDGSSRAAGRVNPAKGKHWTAFVDDSPGIDLAAERSRGIAGRWGAAWPAVLIDLLRSRAACRGLATQTI